MSKRNIFHDLHEKLKHYDLDNYFDSNSAQPSNIVRIALGKESLLKGTINVKGHNEHASCMLYDEYEITGAATGDLSNSGNQDGSLVANTLYIGLLKSIEFCQLSNMLFSVRQPLTIQSLMIKWVNGAVSLEVKKEYKAKIIGIEEFKVKGQSYVNAAFSIYNVSIEAYTYNKEGESIGSDQTEYDFVSGGKTS